MHLLRRASHQTADQYLPDRNLEGSSCYAVRIAYSISSDGLSIPGYQNEYRIIIKLIQRAPLHVKIIRDCRTGSAAWSRAHTDACPRPPSNLVTAVVRMYSCMMSTYGTSLIQDLDSSVHGRSPHESWPENRPQETKRQARDAG
jgi:hypothetical protein